MTAESSTRRSDQKYQRRLSSDAHRVRIEAMAALSRGTSAAATARLLGVSARSVQRWARKLKELGPEALQGPVWPGKSARLAAESLRQLTADISQNPDRLGYEQTRWNAPLLARHIRRRFGLIVGERQCLRILRQLGGAPRNGRNRQDKKSVANGPSALELGSKRVGTAPHNPLPPPPVLSDRPLKQRALKRIQRLASSGLPLQPFAWTLFDLTSEAVPQSGDIRGLCADVHQRSWLFRNLDYLKWEPLIRKYVMEDDAAESGLVRQDWRDPNITTVVPFEQMVFPEFHKLEGYNEFYRRIEAHHFITAMLGLGETLGVFSLSRNESMKPFNADDLHFLDAAAPHITHALKTARLLSSESSAGDNFERFADASMGVALMDFGGRVIALNKEAERLFHQIGVFDGLMADSFAVSVQQALDYVARTMHAIFLSPGETEKIGAPAARIYSHWTGIALRLRGFTTDSSLGQKYFMVLIEQGELEEHRRQRVMFRYGLSLREAELLRLLGSRLATSDIAERMAISTGTVKTYSGRLADKLAAPGFAALRAFAREHHI